MELTHCVGRRLELLLAERRQAIKKMQRARRLNGWAKQLLTGLLIAGLSATAKAELAVYYCNTTSYGQVTKEEVSNIRSYPFKLFIDLEQGKVKISGEISPIEIVDGTRLGRVKAWGDAVGLGQDSFFAHDPTIILDFRDGQLASTRVGELKGTDKFLIASYIASCEKF